jgi:hypothetical protein
MGFCTGHYLSVASFLYNLPAFACKEALNVCLAEIAAINNEIMLGILTPKEPICISTLKKDV